MAVPASEAPASDPEDPSDPLRLLAALSEGVLVLDGEDRALLLNPAAETLLGLGEREVLGRPLSALVADPALIELVARARGSEEALSQRDLSLSTVTGRHRLDCVITPQGDGHLLLELRDRDRAARIREEQRLQDARGAARSMARRLAHEVRNPLGGMRGAAQLLARRLEDPDMTRFTDLIVAEVDRLSALVEALLGPRELPELAPLNPHELIERVIAIIAAELEHDDGSAIAIRRDYDPSLPDLDADADLLVQVLLNLMANAVQALRAAQGSTLRIGTRPLRSFTIGGERHRLCLAIEVEDDGIGVPEALAESIFLPLVSGSERGTGLGLAVAQELVHRHGGLIEFESEPGRTVFTVILPYAERR